MALGRELGVDLLCALVNNNSRCYDESLDFADHMEQILPVGQGVREPKAICTPLSVLLPGFRQHPCSQGEGSLHDEVRQSACS